MTFNLLASKFKDLLAFIRAWKNKVFKDWQWDLLVGLIFSLIGLITNIPYLILLIPFIITIINQFYNKLFEFNDFTLRMIFPLVIWIIKVLIK